MNEADTDPKNGSKTERYVFFLLLLFPFSVAAQLLFSQKKKCSKKKKSKHSHPVPIPIPFLEADIYHLPPKHLICYELFFQSDIDCVFYRCLRKRPEYDSSDEQERTRSDTVIGC